MADIQLTLGGDASGASEAFKEAGDGVKGLADETGKASAKWQMMADVVTAATKAVVKYGVDAIKAYADSERVQRQLTRVAGEYSEALDAQAQALSRLYAVDDDIIKQSETLLVQWGGVGAATRETEQAILDYATATGQDAVAATQDLIRNVESGGTGLAKLGVHFAATGDKGKDLSAAVAALSVKFGGAAATDAASLSGSSRSASLAMDDLQKSIGGMLATVLDKTGGLGLMVDTLHTMTVGADALGAAFERLPGFLAEAIKGKGQATKAMLDEANRLRRDALGGRGDSLADAPSVTGKTNSKLKADASGKSGKTQAELNDISLEEAKKYQKGLEDIEAHAEELRSKEVDGIWKLVDEESNARKEREKDAFAFDKRMAQQEDERVAKEEKDAQASLGKAAKDSADRSKARADDAAKTADAIGSAFVNALSAQLEKLAAGGEFDAALFVGDILAAAVGIAGTVIGTAFGAPAVGAAIGNLAAMGVRAGASGISAQAHKGRRTSQYHSGGWVEDGGGLPRHHSGAWIGPDEQQAILQHGERVLSRKEVGAMGGSGAVDSMARGRGGGVTINVSALDAKSAAESFETEVGHGLRRAARSGRGDVQALLAVGGPR